MLTFFHMIPIVFRLCPCVRVSRVSVYPVCQAILHDKIHIADAVNVEVISLDDAPKGYAEFDQVYCVQ